MIKEELLAAVQTLLQGKVVAHPTETCYGLAADVFNKSAVQHLYKLKGMHMDRPVSILVRDLDEAQAYGEFSPAALKLALAHWPGPLTLVVPRKATLPKFINYGMDSIGIRVSSNKKARQLVEAFGGPITTTSANKAGEPHTYKVEDFMNQGLVPEFILDAGQIGKTPPSTIVKVMGDNVEVLREGTIQLSA